MILLPLPAARDQPVTVGLGTITVTTPYQDRFAFALDPFRLHCLIEGLDEIGLTLARNTAITGYEAATVERRPWIAGRAYASAVVEDARRA